jgi:hypothetical protein
MIQSLDLTNYVVIQLQFLKSVKALEIIDFNNVFERQLEVSEFPKWSVIFSKNFVFTVVLNQVFFYEIIVYDGGLYSLFVFLGFCLVL